MTLKLETLIGTLIAPHTLAASCLVHSSLYDTHPRDITRVMMPCLVNECDPETMSVATVVVHDDCLNLSFTPASVVAVT